MKAEGEGRGEREIVVCVWGGGEEGGGDIALPCTGASRVCVCVCVCVCVRARARAPSNWLRYHNRYRYHTQTLPRSKRYVY